MDGPQICPDRGSLRWWGEQTLNLWPHPYQVDHVGWVRWTHRPSAWEPGPPRFNAGRRHPRLLVAAVDVSSHPPIDRGGGLIELGS
ncbi:hypothetical protein [Streptomyces sp. NPDC048411]|uniref:hypothetical protein n=1 Tax=Streptomyces sp. NPDC048411 TaxID=3157206 RepID=UPI003454DD99